MGCEKMVTSQVMSESLGWLPSVGSQLHMGENSRVSHSKAKEGLFREETHSVQSVGHFRRQKRHQGLGIVSFYRGE